MNGYVYVSAGVHGRQWTHEELQLGQLQAVQIRCLKENSGPLQEQFALLNTEPSLQSQL